MLDTEFESKIRKCIEEVYCCECTFKIKAKEVLDDSQSETPVKTFVVYLYLHDQMIDPMHIIWEGETEEGFLNFLKEDLKHRELIRSKHVNVKLER